jgi:hypothetical protein
VDRFCLGICHVTRSPYDPALVVIGISINARRRFDKVKVC